MNLAKFALAMIAGSMAILAAMAQDSDQPQDEAANPEIILVAGATGRTGRLVITLLKDEGYHVRAMTRNAVNARETIGAEYDWVEADVRNPDSLTRIMKDVSRVISVIGARRGDPTNTPEMVDYGGVAALVDAARAQGSIKHFVLTSSGGVTHEEHALNAAYNNVLMWKLKGEDYLRASGISYTVVRPLGLRDWAGSEYGVILNQGDDVMDGLISRADVAAVIVEALSNEDARNKTFEIYNYKAMTSDAWRKNFSQLMADSHGQPSP